jgi:hypothetical protein
VVTTQIVFFLYLRLTCNHLDPHRGQPIPFLTTPRFDCRASTQWPISANRCGGFSLHFVKRTTKACCVDELVTG